jgi:release factor glutamine methyltransferase
MKRLPVNARFADLCTGSGCIAVATLDLRPDTVADAYELYPKTLELAQKNAELNAVADRFTPILGDVLSEDLLGDNKYDAIISNPPYIRSDVIPTLEKEVLTEPRVALDGGDDGLIFYRSIVNNFGKNLSEDGFFLFEIGYDQADDLKKIADLSGYTCEIFKDLGGCDRAALLRLKKDA